MKRSQPSCLTVPDVLEVYRQEACPEGELYPGYLDTKLGFAKAVCERNFGRLLDCLVEHSSDLIVLRRITGLTLNLARPNVALTKLRQWCGLSDAFERMFKAEQEYFAQEDKLQDVGAGFKTSLVAKVRELAEEGWTDIAAADGHLYAFKPGDRTQGHVISGPKVHKSSFWGVAGGLYKARCAWELAKQEYKAETEMQKRAAYFAVKRSGTNSKPAALFFL